MDDRRMMLGRRYYPAVIVDQIIERVSAGESVTAICADPAMPCAASFFNWLADPELRGKYEQARAAARTRAHI
ncbi:terminase small subunit-like protein [Paraburkholderia tropica]|uniref:terminase small subunit-like protein n=1 Tax=Paraburkholderia tropica TaxID=92647 RepID=UPI002AB6F5CB|nr:hypothetical protein [Paraburkholderia tropica]